MKQYKIIHETAVDVIEIEVKNNIYELEKNGKKSNTTAFLSKKEHHAILNSDPEYIIIKNKANSVEKFIRKLTDITYLCTSSINNDAVYVFSWNPFKEVNSEFIIQLKYVNIDIGE